MAALVSARSRLVLDLEFGSQRRLASNNNRALCQHYFLRRGIANNSTGATLNIGNGWGKIDIPASSGNPLGSQQTFTLLNYFSPGWNGGFTNDVIATAYQPVPFGGGAEHSSELRVQLKSRSPLLAGNLLVMHHPLNTGAGSSSAIQGSIQVNGHATLWKDTDLVGNVGSLNVRSYDHPDMIAENILNLSSNHIPPTNFPFFPRSTGYDQPTTSGSPITDGRFNMVQLGADVTPPDGDAIYKRNTLYHKMVANSSPTVVDGSFDYTVGAVSGDDVGGQRRITINLNDPAVSPVIINDGVYYVRIRGYSSAALGDSEPPGFIIIRSNDLISLEFENNNFRRLVVGMQSASYRTVPVAFTNATSIRMLLTAEKTGMTWNAPVGGSVAIQGGIRTDSTINVASGLLVLNREANPEPLELMDPREAWVEMYQN